MKVAPSEDCWTVYHWPKELITSFLTEFPFFTVIFYIKRKFLIFQIKVWRWWWSSSIKEYFTRLFYGTWPRSALKYYTNHTHISSSQAFLLSGSFYQNKTSVQLKFSGWVGGCEILQRQRQRQRHAILLMAKTELLMTRDYLLFHNAGHIFAKKKR